MLSVALKPLILPCVIYTFASIATPNSIWFCFVELTAAPAPTSIYTQYSLFDLSNNLPCKFYVRIPMILRGSSFNFQLNVSICKPFSRLVSHAHDGSIFFFGNIDSTVFFWLQPFSIFIYVSLSVYSIVLLNCFCFALVFWSRTNIFAKLKKSTRFEPIRFSFPMNRTTIEWLTSWSRHKFEKFQRNIASETKRKSARAKKKDAVIKGQRTNKREKNTYTQKIK